VYSKFIRKLYNSLKKKKKKRIDVLSGIIIMGITHIPIDNNMYQRIYYKSWQLLTKTRFNSFNMYIFFLFNHPYKL